MIGWTDLAWLAYKKKIFFITDTFSFFNFKLYWAIIVGILERSRASVRLLLLSSLPLSCALEHEFRALEWMQMRAFAQRMRNLPPAATS